MSRRLKITGHERHGTNNVIYYEVEGGPGVEAHEFPDATLEWRVAEFDYDPDDKETLVQVILAERWEKPGPAQEIIRRGANERAESKRQRIAAVGLEVARDKAWTDALAMVPAPSPTRVTNKRNLLQDIRETGVPQRKLMP